MQVYKVQIQNGNCLIIYGLVTKAKMLEIVMSNRKHGEVISVEVLQVNKSDTEG